MDIFGGIFGFFGSLFGYVLWASFLLTQNFGVAIIIFTIIVKLVMFPTSINQQKSMAGNQRLQAKQNEIREKYGTDRTKYNEEIQKLYEKEGINPMGGCLTSFLPMILMLGIFYSVGYPLTNTLHLNALSINKIVANINAIPGFSGISSSIYSQIEIVKIFPSISSSSIVTDVLSPLEIEKILNFSHGFNFLGIDLLSTPKDFGISALLLIPVLCFLTSFASQLALTKMSGNPMQQQQGCMKYMFYGLPLISSYFSYTVPAAVGLYWIVSTVIGFIQSLIINKYYSAALMNAKSEARHVAMLFSEEASVKEL